MGSLRQPCVLAIVAVLAIASPVSAQPEDTRPPCAACISVVVESASELRLPATLDGLNLLVRTAVGSHAQAADMLRSIRLRGGRPGLLIETDVPPSDVLAMADTVILAISPDAAPAHFAYEAKTRLTAIRAAVRPSAVVGVRASSSTAGILLAGGAGPYIDVLVSPDRPNGAVRWWRDGGDLISVSAAAGSAAAAERTLLTVRGDVNSVFRQLDDLARAGSWFPSELVPDRTVGVTCNRQPLPVWLNPATQEVISWAPDCEIASLTIHPAREHVETVRLSEGGLLIRLAPMPGDRFTESVDVRATEALTVGEIVARHQAVAARQRAAIRSRLSSGTMTLTFDAPGLAAPVTISAKVTLYESGERTEIEHRAIRVNGLELDERGPRLPIVEPERVASPPLAIELTDAYRYSLEGTAIVRGTTCYVVAFEPADSRRRLFAGRAWIARESFALVRVSAAQTNLRGAIVSSEQIDEFAPIESGLWLLARSQVNQRYEGAGHRTPIERVLTFDRHEVNGADFDERWAAARASSSIMLRDTPQGYRYLRKAVGDNVNEQAQEPALEAPADRVKTIVVGTIVDPNISHPLPYAGLSYVDFNLLGTGTQLNAFYGGTFGQLSFLVPSVAGTRWRIGGSGFAIASRFNDRAFHDGQESYGENIQQRPAHASIWLVRPLSPRISLRTGYDFAFTSFSAAGSTSDTFIVPESQVVHAFRVAVDAQRGGWSGSAWWAPAIRSGWRAWGLAEGRHYHPEHADFQKYGVSLSRSAIVSPALIVRAEAAWMGGQDLDRFSRYAFGSFENRLHGYPSALIRYDRGAIVRGTGAWAVSPRVRIDGFVDSAFVHDPGFGEGLQRFTGIGTAVEVPAPFGTLLAAEWGYGLQGRTADGSRGTHVFRLTALKAF